MKKLVLTLIIAGALLIGTFAVRRFVGDLRPAVLPPAEKAEERITSIPAPGRLGKPTDLPLSVPEGYYLGVFAEELGPARDLQFTPEGTLLVSITRGGKVLALPDADGDGIADDKLTIISDMENPHGLGFYNGKLYIASETSIARYAWDEKSLSAQKETELFSLPLGGRHFTRDIEIADDGTIYVSIGSTCDTCFEENPWHGSIIVSDIQGKNPRIFAPGLRNAVFIRLHPETGRLWATEMGRDFLGDNKPPDEINIVAEGNDYGWPICYGDKVHDFQFDDRRYLRDPCIDTSAPVFNIQAHSAPLGLTFIDSPVFQQDLQGDLLVSYHGSWNRTVPVGYKVVRLNVKGEEVLDERDFISGWLQENRSLGRPVDLEFGPRGNLYISDDKAGLVYILGKKQ